jgi:hypothetical protein
VHFTGRNRHDERGKGCERGRHTLGVQRTDVGIGDDHRAVHASAGVPPEMRGKLLQRSVLYDDM